VLLKLIAMVFVGVSVGRILFKPQMAGLGLWLSRVVDTTLIVIAVVLVVQMAIILAH
jgi:hypothetical protein